MDLRPIVVGDVLDDESTEHAPRLADLVGGVTFRFHTLGLDGAWRYRVPPSAAPER